VLDDFHGILPKTIAELTKIPGVGRKTANVFLGNAYDIYEGIAVDTHVTKQAQGLGLTKQTTPEKIEQDLMQLFDKKDWFSLTYLLIEHGRNKRRKKQDRVMCSDSSCLLCNKND
jgi:endonuclease-3